MSKIDVWDLIKENIVIVVTVVSGIVAAIGYPLGWIPQTVVLSVIVGLLTIFATSEILERRRRFANLESVLGSGFERTIKSLKGVEVQFFETETEFYDYLAARIRTTNRFIKYASLGPSRYKVSPAGQSQRFYKERARMIASGKIRFNYLTMINDRGRLERVQRELEEFDGKQYFVGYFELSKDFIPMVSFTVIDDEELIIGGHRTLYAPSEGTASILIRHQDAARLFSDYFDLLWRHSIKLNEHGIRRDLLETLGKQLAITEET